MFNTFLLKFNSDIKSLYATHKILFLVISIILILYSTDIVPFIPASIAGVIDNPYVKTVLVFLVLTSFTSNIIFLVSAILFLQLIIHYKIGEEIIKCVIKPKTTHHIKHNNMTNIKLVTAPEIIPLHQLPAEITNVGISVDLNEILPEEVLTPKSSNAIKQSESKIQNCQMLLEKAVDSQDKLTYEKHSNEINKETSRKKSIIAAKQAEHIIKTSNDPNLVNWAHNELNKHVAKLVYFNNSEILYDKAVVLSSKGEHNESEKTIQVAQHEENKGFVLSTISDLLDLAKQAFFTNNIDKLKYFVEEIGNKENEYNNLINNNGHVEPNVQHDETNVKPTINYEEQSNIRENDINHFTGYNDSDKYAEY